MDISIVVPSYNRRSLLEHTLDHLLAQRVPEGVGAEIVVVDDGSDDGTRELILDRQRRSARLVYCFVPRERPDAFTAARARNVGARRSTGDVICFVDTGMLVGPDYVRRVAEHQTPREDVVLLHPILGLQLEALPFDLSPPEGFEAMCERLAARPEGRDGREGVFDLVEDDLSRLPAPWALGWSGAFTVSRALFERTGGFDEGFTGWGSEDNDFAYRLFLAGARFRVARDCPALHLPHPRNPTQPQTNRENSRRLHRKLYQLETELYPFFSNLRYNQLLIHLEWLSLAAGLPAYPGRLLGSLRDGYLAGPGPSLLIGLDDVTALRLCPTTDVLAHSRRAERRLTRAFPERKVHGLVGCDTPFPDRAFRVTLVTDFWRIVPPQAFPAFIPEVRRISERVHLLHTEGFRAAMVGLEGPARDRGPLEALLTEQGARPTWTRLDERFSLLSFDGTPPTIASVPDAR